MGDAGSKWGVFPVRFGDWECWARRAGSVLYRDLFMKFSQAVRDFCHLAAAGGNLGRAGREVWDGTGTAFPGKLPRTARKSDR